MTRRWSPRVAALTVAALGLAAVLGGVQGCSPDTTERARTVPALLRALEDHFTGGGDDPHRLTGGDREATVELADTRRNVAAMGITDLRLRLAGASTADAPDPGPGDTTQVVDVEVTWRLAELDRTASTLVLPVAVDEVSGDAVFRTARLAGKHRVPLWLLSALAVRRTPAGLAVAADPSRLERLTAVAQRAAAAARSAVPGWRGSLVVEAPASVEQYARTAGVARSGGWSVVGVTTTADGRRAPGSALRVHLHPTWFWGLGPRGQQVVMSHEAAHVALESVLQPVPAWLAEGMADHVALRHSGIPVRDAAAQAIATVRSDGLPSGLPPDDRLTGSGADSGACYEAAWLAVRLLGQRYGEQALLDFYEMAALDGGTGRAFREVLGTTEDAVVTAWRAELGRLAG